MRKLLIALVVLALLASGGAYASDLLCISGGGCIDDNVTGYFRVVPKLATMDVFFANQGTFGVTANYDVGVWGGARLGFSSANEMSEGDTLETYFTRPAAHSLQLTASHFGLSGTAPTVSSCGSTPSSVVGNDTHGHLTTGSGGSLQACTITFATPATVAPDCFCNDKTSILTVRASSTTTTLTCDSALAGSLASQDINYVCLGN